MPRKGKKHNTNKSTPVETTVEQSPFEETVCKLQTPAAYPSRKIPATKERNSAFIDLDKQDATHADVFQALKQLNTISGVKYRRDLRVVEVIFNSEDERNRRVDEMLNTPAQKKVFMNLPRHLVPKVIYVRLANLPLEGRDEISAAIKTHWSQYGEVMDTAPHMVKGTNWLTHRWDLLIRMPNDNDVLEALVSFELLNHPIIAAWAGCPPSCLICLNAGHQAKKCPSKQLKAGERPDPEKRSVRSDPKTERPKKESKVTPVAQSSSSGSTTKPKTASLTNLIAEVHKRAAGSNLASTSDVTAAPTPSEAMDTEEDIATTQLNPAAAEFNPTGQPQTPPEQIFTLVADPDTPHSDAGKRQAKDDLQAEMDPRFSPEVQQLIRKNDLCFRCGSTRPCFYCPKHPTIGKKHIGSQSVKIINVFGGQVRRTRASSARASSSTGDSTAADPFINVPVFCTKCRKQGHLWGDCPAPDCRYCNSNEHIGVYCLLKPETLYGK